MAIHHEASYIRYRSKLRGVASKPITFKVVDVEKLTRTDMVFAVRSPMAKDRLARRRYMHMHFDRVNGRVYLLRQTVPISDKLRYVPTPETHIHIGNYGELLTL